jgi:hypothetical protein
MSRPTARPPSARVGRIGHRVERLGFGRCLLLTSPASLPLRLPALFPMSDLDSYTGAALLDPRPVYRQLRGAGRPWGCPFRQTTAAGDCIF